VEFGYCFDVRASLTGELVVVRRQDFGRADKFDQVSNRAFFPLYLHLYVLQFLLLPILTRHSDSSPSFLATFLGNTLYLSAFIYYIYITFLGYNALPFLHHTELLLLPILILGVLWLVSLIVGWGIVGQGGAVAGLFWFT
jgi:hypothetical protein